MTIDQFTVVCSVPWPLNGSKAGRDVVLLQTLSFFMCKSWYSHANKPVNMIIYIWKTLKVCKKTRSPPASLLFKGQGSAHTTVKWPITKTMDIIRGTYVTSGFDIYRIFSINRPGHLLNFWTLRVGAYSRWAFIRGWALIKFSPFSASVVVYFATKQ